MARCGAVAVAHLDIRIIAALLTLDLTVVLVLLAAILRRRALSWFVLR